MKAIKPYFTFLLLLGLLLMAGSLFAQQAELIVDVHSLRDNKGTVRAWVFATKKGFPNKGETALTHADARITNGRTQLRFQGLEVGKSYAVSIIHDANDNKVLDSNWMGIPSEGFGCSRDAPARMGPPDYEDALFRFESAGQQIKIKMRYM